ncbi:MAG: Nif11 family protein [Ruminiclostridium sp.]|nr:Nif11 family protein [Ruminiclostridium sp.]
MSKETARKFITEAMNNEEFKAKVQDIEDPAKIVKH